MHALIIGGTRFVGRALVWRLLAGGHRVTLFNRGSHVDPFGDHVERIVGDRTTPELEARLRGRSFDAMIDFAAYEADDVRRVISAFEGRVGHYVFISTGQVYLVRDPRPALAREEDYEGAVMRAPDDERELGQFRYGDGKRACEDALIAARGRFASTRLRLPMVNGESDYDRRIEKYLWRILDGGPVILPDGGARRTRHVYGNDVAALIASMLGEPRAIGEAFNVAQQETPTLAELIALLAKHLGAVDRSVSVPAAAIVAAGLDPAQLSPFSGRWMSFLDPSKVVRTLGFRSTPLDEQLGRIVASFLAHTPSTPPRGYEQRDRERALVKAMR